MLTLIVSNRQDPEKDCPKSSMYNDELEVTYLESKDFFEHRNLEDYFHELRIQKQNKKISAVDFDKIVLIYAKNMAQLFYTINQKDLWYTDLKPSTILLTKEKEIAISDLQGLIISPKNIIAASKIITSQSYFQSNVFTKSYINLELLQCQTLANSLYQIACGSLPEQSHSDDGKWINNYNFNQPVFKGTLRVFLKELITNLNSRKPSTMNHLLNSLSEQILTYDELETKVLLNINLIDKSTTKRPDAYF